MKMAEDMSIHLRTFLLTCRSQGQWTWGLVGSQFRLYFSLAVAWYSSAKPRYKVLVTHKVKTHINIGIIDGLVSHRAVAMITRFNTHGSVLLQKWYLILFMMLTCSRFVNHVIRVALSTYLNPFGKLLIKSVGSECTRVIWSWVAWRVSRVVKNWQYLCHSAFWEDDAIEEVASPNYIETGNFVNIWDKFTPSSNITPTVFTLYGLERKGWYSFIIQYPLVEKYKAWILH